MTFHTVLKMHDEAMWQMSLKYTLTETNKRLVTSMYTFTGSVLPAGQKEHKIHFSADLWGTKKYLGRRQMFEVLCENVYT